MKNALSLSDKIEQVSRYSRDPKLRRRADLFLKALELGNVAEACRQMKTSPQLYHYWWRRFQKEEFRKEALQDRSRRPKNIPRRLRPQAAQWICRFRKAGKSGEEIRLLLEKEKKLIVSLPTVYRVLTREGLKARKKKKEVRGIPFEGEKKKLIFKGTPAGGAESLPIPQKIAGSYRVLKPLGSGGGGAVYQVEDPKGEGPPLALKLLELHRETDPALATHLKNEFIALSSLQHPHIARVHDFGMGAREIFFTSEYIHGKDLLTATQGADLNLIFQWLVQILSALDFIHRKGILHLDLKPMNILVTDPDEAGEVAVKLIDFGSADCRKAGQAAPGELMGTPPYVAPELLMEMQPTPASDLYSLGMILHQIFFGAFPFEETDPLLMMKEQIYQSPKRLSGLPPALPDEFTDLLLKMVQPDPARRFSSAFEILEALNSSLGENFSLRSARAPVRILEESDFIFHPRQADEILALLGVGKSRLVILSGGEGMGKSRLWAKVKERLQLQGIFPFVFQDFPSLRKFLETSSASPKNPLLVDAEGDPPDFIQILESIDARGFTALITTERTRGHDFFAHHWVELKALSPEILHDFFRKEIRDFPFADTETSLIQLSEGHPKKLELVLQSLQEEGLLQWSEFGWQWQRGIEIRFDTLVPSQEARWSERRRRVIELLSLTPMGLSTETLGGILGLAAGSLEEKLKEWADAGVLKTKIVKKIAHYSAKEMAEDQKIISLPEVGKLRSELEALYAEGNFEAGSRWADLIFSDESRLPTLPPDLRLICARHYAAYGQATKALELLSGSTFGRESRGLFLEIRGRAQFILGNLEEASSELERSEENYQSQGDASGLSRVFNLRGSLFKKLSEVDRAKEAFQKSIENAGVSGDAYLKGLAQMNLALFFQERGEFDEAVASFEGALDSGHRAGHPLLSARLKQNWLNLLFSMGRAPEAEKISYELLQLSLKHHYVEIQASALNYLALLAGQKNHKELQLHFLNQALGLLKSRDLWFPYTQSLINRAFFYWEQNRFTPAELDAEYAQSLARRQKHPWFIAWSQWILGKILRDRPRPDFEQADELFARARQGIWKIKNQPLFWEVEFDRGLLAKKRGEREKARELFQSAKTHLEELL